MHAVVQVERSRAEYGRGRHTLGNCGVAFDRTELGLEIGLAVDALARNPWIEKIRAEVHGDRKFGRQ